MNSHVIDKYNIFSLTKSLNQLITFSEKDDLYKVAQKHYAELYTIYDELERIVSGQECYELQSIFSDEKIISSLPRLYQLRSAFEYFEEWKLATNVLKSKQSTKLLRNEIAKKLSNLPEEFLNLIDSFDKVVFAGSGPLPKTALAFAQYSKNKEILCLDYCQEANDMAQHYVDLSGIEANISFATTDIMEFDRFNEYDVVVGAFLLGVDDKISSHADKSNFTKKLIDELSDKADLILRIPQGLGTLIYPAVLPDILLRDDVDCYPKQSDNNAYNSYFFHMKSAFASSNAKLVMGM